MNILHLSTSGDGGAAIAARRIHQAVRGAGSDSHLLFRLPPHRLATGERKLYPSQTLVDRLRLKLGLARTECERIHTALEGRDKTVGEMFTSIRSDYDVLATPEYEEADIVHLHWVGDFLDWPMFFRHNRKPVVWSLCDMNPLTGGCHYDESCGRFTEPPGCYECPQLVGSREPDWAQKALEEKDRLMSNLPSSLTFIPPAPWMRSMIEESLVFGDFPIREIPHLGDNSIYSPLPREACREALGLPLSSILLLYVCDSQSHRKGFTLLSGALENASIPELHCVFLGPIAKEDLPRNATHVPSTGEERLLNLYYNAADAVVIPSLQENLALTFIDSQLCGTPAITFDIGCFRDHLDDGQNGIKATETTSESLAEAIQRFAESRENFDRDSIAATAHDRYSTKSLLPKYLSLYEDCLAN